MHPQLLTPSELSRAVAVRDLSDPSQGPHAIQLILDAAVDALARAWSCAVVVHRASPFVSMHTLRTNTSAMVPPLLKRIAGAPPEDVLLVCPGAVYPPDSSHDGLRSRAAVPHQVDLWRIRRGTPFGLRDLAQMIGPMTAAVVPEFTISAVAAPLPRTTAARQIDVRLQGKWVTIGRCGLVEPELLRDSGLPVDASAMAMTLDLDRLVMLAKGIDDVSLLRSREAGVAAQMLDLEPYVPASPPAETRRPRELLAGNAATLASVRASIDDVDIRIVKLLAERRSYVVQAAKFKKSVNEVRVPAREEQVIANVREVASKAGIEPDVVEDLYRHIIDRLVRIEIAAHPRASDASASRPIGAPQPSHVGSCSYR